MKMGPSVADSSAVLCKPAYGGNVYLYYSLDGGAVWETLTILETFAYRTEEFTEVLSYIFSSRAAVFHWLCCVAVLCCVRLFFFVLLIC